MLRYSYKSKERTKTMKTATTEKRDILIKTPNGKRTIRYATIKETEFTKNFDDTWILHFIRQNDSDVKVLYLNKGKLKESDI